mgnify:CR=1 FL=1
MGRALLKLGVDATAQDANGETALDISKRPQHIELVKLLEKHLKVRG